jgi:hypothetical protein
MSFTVSTGGAVEPQDAPAGGQGAEAPMKGINVAPPDDDQAGPPIEDINTVPPYDEEMQPPLELISPPSGPSQN